MDNDMMMIHDTALTSKVTFINKEKNDTSMVATSSLQQQPTPPPLLPLLPLPLSSSVVTSVPPLMSSILDLATVGPNQYRPLNVKDALSYLDQVKNQFGNQLDVYNRFLDIMKEFKSQSIDTPGVIRRVSTLFRGHPNLITGFNTFLPHGYRIEATNDPSNPIRVTTPPESNSITYGEVINNAVAAIQAKSPSPSNTAISHQPSPTSGATSHTHTSSPQKSEWSSSNNVDLLDRLPGASPALIPISNQNYPAASAASTQSSSISAVPQNRNLLGISGAGLPGASPPSVTAAASTNSAARSPMEFNHAINYVNKIMSRFSGERETYKQFLEILQTYQKEQKPIQEVYTQIAVLFKDHKDLLEEFKLFLPDTVQNNNVGALPHNGVGQLRIAADLKRSSSGVRKQCNKRSSSANSSAISTPLFLPPPPSTAQNHSVYQQSRKKSKSATTPVKNQSGHLSATASIAAPTDLDDELGFFERAKRAIGNKTTYNEFLKVLNLFSQELIDIKTLVDRVEPFLGWQPDLFEWFKKFVQYEEEELIHNELGPSRGLDLRASTRSGRSYRLLPPEIPRPICSNRDDLGKEVLNDDWISTPVYMSESGEIGYHKKTMYEEAIFNVESERYEFDIHIEANLHTIGVLEPIAAQIQTMSAEEKTKFKLPLGLVSGGSKSIYQRIIKKVYERDRGLEVLEALHNNPAVAVPVVLRRLKQKDEEWKRAQREWNKIWRDIDMKNFYKSLDHQGVTFKTTDRKAISIKHLIQEIEVLHREQRHKKPNHAIQHQYDFAFRYSQVFEDMRHLLVSLVRLSHTYTEQDQERVMSFLSLFIPAFFFLNKGNDSDGGYQYPRNSSMSVDGADTVSEASMETDDSPIIKDKKVKSNLRRNLLSRKVPPPAKRQKLSGHEEVVDLDDDGQSIDSRSETNSDAAKSPGQPFHQHITSNITPVLNIKNDKISHVKPIYPTRPTFTLYANNVLYGFFRLYELAYARLAKMKELSDDLAKYPPRRVNPTVIELGLKAGQDARTFLGDRYDGLIKIIHELIEGRMENNEFEDRVRQMYGTSAYLMFTIDKVLQAVVKQFQVMASDARTLDLLSLYYRDRDNMTTSTKQEGMYKLAAFGIMAEGENMYRLEYFIAEKVMTIQLVSNDEAADPDTMSPEQRWSLYVDRYVQVGPTDAAYMFFLLRRPFLKRLLPAPTNIPDDSLFSVGYVTRSNLEIKITVNTFKLFYVAHTEDVFYRPALSRLVAVPAAKKNVDLKAAAVKSAKIRSSRFYAWLNGRVQHIEQGLRESGLKKEAEKAPLLEVEQAIAEDVAVAPEVVMAMEMDESTPTDKGTLDAEIP